MTLKELNIELDKVEFELEHNDMVNPDLIILKIELMKSIIFRLDQERKAA